MGKRRQARELALQLLYELDLRPQDDPSAAADVFWSRHPVAEDVRTFADGIVQGTRSHQPAIDALLGRLAEHWALDRMAVVDRNILRAGVYELLWGGAPHRVVINEALEIARKYSTEESTRFVNGLLDRVHRERVP